MNWNYIIHIGIISLSLLLAALTRAHQVFSEVPDSGPDPCRYPPAGLLQFHSSLVGTQERLSGRVGLPPAQPELHCHDVACNG
jgi:hypothetical protein